MKPSNRMNHVTGSTKARIKNGTANPKTTTATKRTRFKTLLGSASGSMVGISG